MADQGPAKSVKVAGLARLAWTRRGGGQLGEQDGQDGLFSDKKGFCGQNVQVVATLSGRLADVGDPCPGAMHDSHAFGQSGIATRWAAHYQPGVPGMNTANDRVCMDFVANLTGTRMGQSPKEAVDEFLYGGHLRSSTVGRNELALRQLAEYAQAAGWEACTPAATAQVRVRHQPSWVFTDDEVRRLFAAIDPRAISSYSNKAMVDPVLFRALFGAGLRVSEALNLSLADVDTRWDAADPRLEERPEPDRARHRSAHRDPGGLHRGRAPRPRRHRLRFYSVAAGRPISYRAVETVHNRQSFCDGRLYARTTRDLCTTVTKRIALSDRHLHNQTGAVLLDQSMDLPRPWK